MVFRWHQVYVWEMWKFSATEKCHSFQVLIDNSRVDFLDYGWGNKLQQHGREVSSVLANDIENKRWTLCFNVLK